MAYFIERPPNPLSLSGGIKGFGRIVAAFEQLDCVPARWSAEIWPVVLRDVEPVKQVLCKSALRTKQVVLMPPGTASSRSCLLCHCQI